LRLSEDSGVEASFSEETITGSEPPPPPVAPPYITAPGPVSAAGAPPGSLLDEVDRMVQRLPIGNIAFNVPK
jgi:hypothetical protein